MRFYFGITAVKRNLTLYLAIKDTKLQKQALRLLFVKGDSSKIRADLLRKVENILTRRHAAKEIKDMNAPGLNLHELKGERKGTWSVTVKATWRITFIFKDEEATEVNLEDHR